MKLRLDTLIFLIPVVLLSQFTFAQKKIKSLAINEEIISTFVDRPGDLYIQTKGGQIQKFDKDGTLISVYKNNPPPTLFDPRDGSRLFAYYRTDQHYAFLSPSFDVTGAHKMDASIAINPWLVCISGDHNLWILDAEDLSIKKFNATTGTVDVDAKVSEKSTDSIASYVSIREYQSFLFLLHKEKGIIIFNRLGKLLKVIKPSPVSYFNFLGEELYYPMEGGIRFFNLFTGESRDMPLKEVGKFVLLTDERLFVVHPTSIDFFELKP